MGDAQEFLDHLFCDSYCEECGGDAEHHEVISDFPFAGMHFASCRFPVDDEDNRHPVVEAFRLAAE